MTTEVTAVDQIEMQPRADCEACSWAIGPSAQSKDRALRHARQRGHQVRVITEHITFYQPAEDSHA